MVYVVKSSESDEGQRFIAAVDGVALEKGGELERVTFDCEGVNLSRIGTVEIISICFKAMDTFLVDMGGDPDPVIIKTVRELMENEMVVKIIHDCRMDCDALFHLHGIEVKNIHDTSCYHHVLTGAEDKNLNSVLMDNGISANTARDSNVYKINHAFWATRPLTKRMIEWASSDVDKLFELESKQLERLTERQKMEAIAKSVKYGTYARDRKIVTGLKVNSPGCFIGRGGCNLRNLQKVTGTVIYQQKPMNTWFVYYEDDQGLARVKRSMNN
mmetsp:Transcript_4427/g.6786  ORF Transcript_4427/g.6786 Transcript_4427/m.6786 type:complete len:272 (-) Transcript_4427:317-1132(-)